MAPFAARVTTDVDEVTDAQRDHYVDALTPYAGVPSMHGGHLTLQLIVDDVDLYAAHHTAERVAHAAAVGAGLRACTVAVEVLTSAEFERRLMSD